MTLTRAKLDVLLWLTSGLALAVLISAGVWLELNVIDSTYKETVVDGHTYSRGSDMNGLLGTVTGILGGVCVVAWIGIGVSWLYRRAEDAS